MIENSKVVNLNKECEKIRTRLEKYGGHPIRLVEDDSVKYGGIIEYCITNHHYENVIRYNPNGCRDSLLHGLLRLEMAIDNTIAGSKRTVVMKSHHRKRFHKIYGREMRKLYKTEHTQMVHEIETLIYEDHVGELTNMAMDLLVMEKQFREYPSFRSMLKRRLEKRLWTEIDNLEASEYMGYAPKNCERIGKILNLVYAMHYRELFDADIVDVFSPKDDELKHASDLYEEFKACCRFFKPGKEYELLEYFAASLGMDTLFSICEEPAEDIRLHPGFDDDESTLERLCEEHWNSEHEEIPSEVRKAQKEQFARAFEDGESNGLTEKMANLMVEAAESYLGMTMAKVANIALETARMCHKGVYPKGHYSLTTIPGKDFSGWQILAHMYVSMRMINPDLLASLDLPFETAFKLACKIYDKKYGFDS